MNRRLIWVITLIIITSPLQAQEAKVFSLDECIKIALENNSQLRNAARNIKLAGTDVTSARSAMLPLLDLGLSSGRFIQGERKRKADVPVGFDPTTGQVFYEQRDIIQAKVERNSHYAYVRLDQTLFDWGRDLFRLKQANLGKQSKEYSYQSMRNSVVYDVQRNYFELLRALKVGEVYEEAVKRSQEQLNRTQSMYEIGSVALADVYKARVAVGNDQIKLITQKNAIIQAKADLNNALALDPNSAIEIEKIDPPISAIPYSLDDALNISLENNLELKNYRLNVENYKYEKRNAKLAFLPSFYGSVRYSRDNEYLDRVYSTKLNEDYSFSLGAQMNLNIFKGFADQAELSRQSINYAKAQEDLFEQKRLLKASVTYALNSLKAYKEIAEINEENIKSAEEDLRLAEERYRIGAGTLLEVIDAQLTVTDARRMLISAKYDTQIALAYLQLIMGLNE